VAQLSLPYRIALVGLLVVAALWFTVLKPKDPAVEPASTAPGTAGLATATDAAKGAATAGDTSAAATTAAANSAGASPATSGTATTGGTAATAPATTAPAAATAPKAKAASAAAGDPSAPLLSALDRKRAVVLLFWNPRASDDAEVRRAVTAVNRRGGRAVVKVVPIRDVGRYQAITRGVQVLTSPTTLVISSDRTARSITGLTTAGELDQMVGDALTAARKS
jgi:hypothetical protein